jgi:hypothetical protein
MPITKNSNQFVTEVMAPPISYSIGQVRARINEANIEILLIGDPPKRERIGTLVGPCSAPLNMLGARSDPDSPNHKPLFADESKQCIWFFGAGWQPKPCSRSWE